MTYMGVEVEDLLTSHPVTAGIRSSLPTTLNSISSLDNGLMNGSNSDNKRSQFPGFVMLRQK